MDRFELGVIVRLHAQMIDPRRLPAMGNREIDARVFQHPLRVVGLYDIGLFPEHRRIECDALAEIADCNMYVETFHRDPKNCSVRQQRGYN